MSAIASQSTHFKSLLHEHGIFEAMRFLNSKSIHRFTALYRFDGPTLRNVCLVDKEDESVRQTGPIDVRDSYCFYVRHSEQKFVVPDSLADERVVEHAKRAIIQSYCGMPLMGDQSMLGSLCHFDFIPRSYTEEEVLLLEMVTPALVAWLQNHPEP